MSSELIFWQKHVENVREPDDETVEASSSDLSEEATIGTEEQALVPEERLPDSSHGNHEPLLASGEASECLSGAILGEDSDGALISNAVQLKTTPANPEGVRTGESSQALLDASSVVSLRSNSLYLDDTDFQSD